MTETLRHREAFEHYYRLGEGRSLGLVAGEYGVSEKSVAAWSKAFGWQQRVADRDAEIARSLRQRTDADVVAERLRVRRVVRDAIAEFANGIEEGRIQVVSVADFERLVKLGLLLDGEATESVRHRYDWEEVIGLGSLEDEELGERLAQAAAMLTKEIQDIGAGAAPRDLPAIP
jgi:hypothetical protein